MNKIPAQLTQEQIGVLIDLSQNFEFVKYAVCPLPRRPELNHLASGNSP